MIDQSNGVLFHYYDVDTGMIYLIGKVIGYESTWAYGDMSRYSGGFSLSVVCMSVVISFASS